MLKFNTLPYPLKDAPLLVDNSGVNPFMDHLDLGVECVGRVGYRPLLNFNTQSDAALYVQQSASGRNPHSNVDSHECKTCWPLNFNTSPLALPSGHGVLKFNEASIHSGAFGLSRMPSVRSSLPVGCPASPLKFNTLLPPSFAEEAGCYPCRAETPSWMIGTGERWSLNFNTPTPPGRSIRTQTQSSHPKRWLDYFWGPENQMGVPERWSNG